MDKATPIKPSTDRQSNTNTDINRQTKQHQCKHQQRDKTTQIKHEKRDKTTPIQTSTDRQNNTNENIDR